MRIAIVDDDQTTREQLINYIDRYFDSQADKYVISQFMDGDEILENYCADFDLILLDIQMKRVDGMKTAEMLRALDESVYLIFVTNLSHYAIRGYSVNALDFVLKPVSYLMLKQILQRVEKLLEKRTQRFITLPTDHGMARVDTALIDYIETEGRFLLVHTDKGVYRLRDTMKNMENQLCEFGFYRCNNCYLVNLARIECIDNKSTIVNGKALSVSRPRHKGFMDALTAYIGSGRG